jgi:hypothetical protein
MRRAAVRAQGSYGVDRQHGVGASATDGGAGSRQGVSKMLRVTEGPRDERPLNDAALLKQLDLLGDTDRAVLKETLAALMSDQVRRIEYATSRATAIATVGGVLLAAGIAGLLQMTKDEWDYFPGWLGLFVLVITLTMTGAVVLWVWGRQTNWDYPFKAVSQTWKHFYRDAVPGVGEPRVPWHAGISDTFRTTKEAQYTEGRSGFIERSLSLRNPSVSVAQDLEQSYLLHWTDLYKNQFLSSLRQVFVYGVIASLTAALVAFVIGACVAGDLFDGEDRGSSKTTTEDTATSTTRSKPPDE